MSAGPVTVAVVDDHPVTRAGSRYLLEQAGVTVTGEAADLEATWALVRASPPSVLLLDLNLSDGFVLDSIPDLRRAAPGMRVVVLTMHRETALVRAALHAGADGYLLKDAPGGDLVAAVRAVAAGRPYLHPDLGGRLHREAGPAGGLGRRERRALRLWAAGLTHKQVAAELNIGIRSVDRLRGDLRERYGLQDRAEIVAFVRDHLGEDAGSAAP